MQFASVLYVVFLAVAVAVHFALPGPRTRTMWLLAASYLFYFSLSASWTLVLLAVTVIGYSFGLILERGRPSDGVAPIAGRTRVVLSAGVALVVSILFVFKYAAFAGGLVNGGLELLGVATDIPTLRLVLPIGISFWTFQSIAYLVDVARGAVPAERNVLRYALFVAFFPHVTAGPIARARQLMPQFAERHAFSYEGMRSGLLLMLRGFVKKLLVADSLAVVVAKVYGDPRAYGDSGLLLAAASLAFAVQIYCDFSGYTDIARGTARLFGVELMPNFARPYAARSVKEFWRRWHMTLMSWLRDYVYIPLGGSRVSKARRYANILVVFGLSGLWHGAGLTFLFWGLLNGAYQIAGEVLAPWRDRLARLVRVAPDGRIRHAVQVCLTFALVTVGWVFFRADSLGDALYILPRMLVPTFGPLGAGALLELGLSAPQLVVAILAAALVFVAEWAADRTDLPAWLFRKPVAVRWTVYQLAILAVLVLGRYGPGFTAADFVYFKF